jgi:hypothetical protein
MNINTTSTYPPVNQQSGYTHDPPYSASTAAYPSPPAPSYLPQTSSSGAQQRQSLIGRTTLQTGPPEETTDKELLEKGAKVRGKIRGTKGRKEKLDESK